MLGGMSEPTPSTPTTPDTKLPTIAWIGTGVMGGPMAGHLIDAGYELHLYTRTAAKAAPLVERGATLHDSAAAAAEGRDVVCTMVGLPDDVRATVLGESGAIAHMAAGGLFIDFTTSSPALAVEIAEAAAARDIEALDAPVSGGDVGARAGTLSIMVGGSEAAYTRAHPILDLVGGTIVLQGPAGSGQHTKMVNQIVIAGNMIGMCEAVQYARNAGLDPATVLQSIGGGAAASWTLSNLCPRILKGDMEPGFFIEHFVKDMGIAADESAQLGLDLPGLNLVLGMYEKLATDGHGRLGTQALIKAFEQG